MNEQANNVEWKETGVLERIADVADKRIICLYGGSSSSKTISALQYLTTWCLEYPEPLVVTVIGESVPVIKKSVYRDWKRVVMRGTYDPRQYNKLEMTYTFPNGSILQFVPADDEDRFVSIRHDFVLIDEAYNVAKGIFDQVEIRTRRQLLLTWNPVSPFWATHLSDTRGDVAVLHATYKDNPFVEQSIIDSLEIRANTDPNFYNVYVLGVYGSIEGLIFKEGTNWFLCDDLPPVDERKRTLYVVDYGFTHDPSAIGELVYSDGQFWYDEIEYKPGMFNTDIHDVIKLRSLPDDKEPPEEPLTHEDLKKVKTRTEVVADSAEPKSNAELKGYGLNVIPAVKGPDSIKFGITTMKGFRLNVTKNSTNTIKELRNYSWLKDRHGEYTETPVDNWNHCFEAGTLIDTEFGRVPIKAVGIGERVWTGAGLKRVIKSGVSGYTEIWNYKINIGIFEVEINCTPNHHIKTSNGWKPIKDLKSNDRIYLRKNLTESNIICTQTKGIIQGEENDFMLSYGNTIVAQYQKAFMFITKMRTQITTQLKTWNWLNGLNISKAMDKTGSGKTRSGLKSFTKKALRPPRIGINQKREKNGIKSITQHTATKCTFPNHINALSVERPSCRQKKPSSVQTNANQQTGEKPALITKKETASIVGRHSFVTDIPEDNIAAAHVITNIKSKFSKIDFVYDLTISEQQEFFANGILVLNSIDGIRYGVTHVRRNPNFGHYAVS